MWYADGTIHNAVTIKVEVCKIYTRRPPHLNLRLQLTRYDKTDHLG